MEETDTPSLKKIIGLLEEHLETKIQQKINEPNHNLDKLLAYKEGLEDSLKALKDHLLHDKDETKSAKTPLVLLDTMNFSGAEEKPEEWKEFEGKVCSRGDPDYHIHCYQYAFTSVEKKNPGSMNPKYILYPKGDSDVLKAIQYAKKKNVKIAIRTGGHQYCGASSTNGENILLDMSETYHSFEDLEGGLIKTGISHTLREFLTFLSQRKMFLPTGACAHVHLGGHIQTGGYGLLARCFGLLGDHVERIRIITADEHNPIREIDKEAASQEERDLYWALLGGSPGNFGVITHAWFRPYRDEDYAGSRGIKALYWYSKDRLRRLLDVLLDMTCDEDLPRNCDFALMVVSSSGLVLHHLWPNFDEEMKFHHPELYGTNYDPSLNPTMIIINAQWVNLEKVDPQSKPYDPSWFKKITDAGGLQGPPLLPHKINYEDVTPMSDIAIAWVFGNVREYILPYEKRSYSTNWTHQLRERKWVEWMSNRVEELQSNPLNGLKMITQFQVYGGKHSQFRAKASDKTSFNWRDSTLMFSCDAFYEEPSKLRHGDPHANALLWQQKNDEGRGNPEAIFCDKDRRVLWGSYDYDLSKAREFYFEKGKWERLLKIKERWDPSKIFSPNKFCVGEEEEPSEEKICPTGSGVAHGLVSEAHMLSHLVKRREEHLKRHNSPALEEEQNMARLLELDKHSMIKHENKVRSI